MNLWIIATTILILLQNAHGGDWRDEAEARKSKAFAMWTKFERGFESVTVKPGQNLLIRCRVSIYGTEWSDEDQLENVTITFSKDGVTLPDYWNNEDVRGKDDVISHTKVSFEYVNVNDRHRGWYKCEGSFGELIDSKTFYVRVKGEGWHWPGLLLGLEGILLCVIYYLYEKWLLKNEHNIRHDDD